MLAPAPDLSIESARQLCDSGPGLSRRIAAQQASAAFRASPYRRQPQSPVPGLRPRWWPSEPAHEPRHDQRLDSAATASHPATGRLRVRYLVARPRWPFCEKALCARGTFQRSGMTSTGRCACTTTADDTLPRSTDWTRDRPRAPTTIGSASSFLASSQIARQLLPFATLPRTSNPAVRASASPRSDVSRATWLAISSRPSPFEASLDMGPVRIVAGPYGTHSPAASHTVTTTPVRGPSAAPAFAIPVAASFDPSKH